MTFYVYGNRGLQSKGRLKTYEGGYSHEGGYRLVMSNVTKNVCYNCDFQLVFFYVANRNPK